MTLGLAVLLLAAPAGAAPGTAGAGRVITVAGGGLGDGGPAISASFGYLGGVVVDRSGDIYVADRGHHLVRRLSSSSGQVETVAGTGKDGSGPDSGPARSIPIAVHFMAIDREGNLVFTDRSRVRLLEPATGLLRTIAGNGAGLWRGGATIEGAQARDVPFGFLGGVAVARNGDVLVADPARSQILRIDSAGRLSTFFRFSAQLAATERDTRDAVFDVAVAPSGDVYFSDQLHGQVFRIVSGQAVRVAGGGERALGWVSEDGAPTLAQPRDLNALGARIENPTQLAFDATGNLYFGEGRGSLRMVDRAGRIHTVWGPAASRWEVSGVAVTGNGDLILAANQNLQVGQVFRLPSNAGVPVAFAGSGAPHCCGDGGSATSAALASPNGVAVAPDGDLVIVDRANHRIRRVDARTRTIATIAGGGDYAPPGYRHITFRPLRSPPPPGRTPATLFEVLEPLFVAVDSAGNVLFARSSGPIYRVEALDGALTTVGKTQGEAKDHEPFAVFASIGGIAAGTQGETVVAGDGRIWKILPEGDVSIVAGTSRQGYSGDGGFGFLADLSRPGWPAVDKHGNIYFVDSGSYHIRKINRSSKISTIAGNGQAWTSGPGEALRESIGSATGLAVDPSGEALFYASGNRVWRLDRKTGVLEALAGEEEVPDFVSPADPLAGLRKLGRPLALATAPGVLYFSEPGCDRVRVLVPPS